MEIQEYELQPNIKNRVAKNTQVKRNHQTQSKQAEYRGTKNIKCCSKHSKHTRNFTLRLRHKSLN